MYAVDCQICYQKQLYMEQYTKLLSGVNSALGGVIAHRSNLLHHPSLQKTVTTKAKTNIRVCFMLAVLYKGVIPKGKAKVVSDIGIPSVTTKKFPATITLLMVKRRRS